MTQVLRASTSVSVLIGPFVDQTDAFTPETAETPVVKLSKNGGSLGVKNEGVTPPHDADGYYACALNGTDTASEGTLILTVAASASALPVRHEITVVSEAVYDDLYASSAAGYAVATDIVSAGAINTLAGAVVNVDLVDTTTVNTDMRGTDGVDTSTMRGTDGVDTAAMRGTDGVDTATMRGTDSAALQTETQNIQSRLPASLSLGKMQSDVLSIGGTTGAADNLEQAALATVIGTAAAGTLTTEVMTTGLSELTDDHYIGRTVIWTTGPLAGQASDITDYAGAGGTLTYSTVTGPPNAGNKFIIV